MVWVSYQFCEGPCDVWSASANWEELQGRFVWYVELLSPSSGGSTLQPQLGEGVSVTELHQDSNTRTVSLLLLLSSWSRSFLFSTSARSVGERCDQTSSDDSLCFQEVFFLMCVYLIPIVWLFCPTLTDLHNCDCSEHAEVCVGAVHHDSSLTDTPASAADWLLWMHNPSCVQRVRMEISLASLQQGVTVQGLMVLTPPAETICSPLFLVSNTMLLKISTSDFLSFY